MGTILRKLLARHGKLLVGASFVGVLLACPVAVYVGIVAGGTFGGGFGEMAGFGGLFILPGIVIGFAVVAGLILSAGLLLGAAIGYAFKWLISTL